MPLKEQALKRLSKKAKKGMRGWPVGTVAFYGPDLSRASKVVAGIVPHEGAETSDIRTWFATDGGDARLSTTAALVSLSGPQAAKNLPVGLTGKRLARGIGRRRFPVREILSAAKNDSTDDPRLSQ